MKKSKKVHRTKHARVHHRKSEEPTHIPRQLFLLVMLFFVISFFALFMMK